MKKNNSNLMFFKVLLILSIVFLVIIVLKIFDSYTSLKYEVDEPRAMGKISDMLVEREMYIKAIINWLWITFAYTSITIITCIKALVNK